MPISGAVDHPTNHPPPTHPPRPAHPPHSLGLLTYLHANRVASVCGSDPSAYDRPLLKFTKACVAKQGGKLSFRLWGERREQAGGGGV